MMDVETRDGQTVTATGRWALIEEGIVVAVILWSGDTETYNPTPRLAVELNADQLTVSDGWLFDGQEFTPPPADPEPIEIEADPQV